MAEAAFPGKNPKIKIFGSIKTGLALKTSDMDIAVTGFKIDGRKEMIDYLNALAD
jgi:DNA polymerase sigma